MHLRYHTLLSFPPDARSWWSVDHFSPHTSCRWPWRRRSVCMGGVRMSRWRIILSRLPEESWSAFQARAPGRLRETGKRCSTWLFDKTHASSNDQERWLLIAEPLPPFDIIGWMWGQGHFHKYSSCSKESCWAAKCLQLLIMPVLTEERIQRALKETFQIKNKLLSMQSMEYPSPKLHRSTTDKTSTVYTTLSNSAREKGTLVLLCFPYPLWLCDPPAWRASFQLQHPRSVQTPCGSRPPPGCPK